MRTDGRTDGQLIVAFHNFAKAPKNQLVSTDGRHVLPVSTFYSAVSVMFLENGVHHISFSTEKICFKSDV